MWRPFYRLPGNTLACLVWLFGLLIAAPLSCPLRLCCERRLGHVPWLFFTSTCYSISRFVCNTIACSVWHLFYRLPGNTLACLVWLFGLLIAAPLLCPLRLCCERRLGHIPWLFFTSTCFSDELSKHSKDSYLSIILACFSSVDIWLQEFVGMGVRRPSAALH